MISYTELIQKQSSIAIIGLGYVGLPLAVALAKHMKVIGFDISPTRIKELIEEYDRTNEVDKIKLQSVSIDYTLDAVKINEAGLIIITVPTPIDKYCSPDLNPIITSTTTVGRHLSKGSVVVYESTVYPGLTEELCIPILEKESGLKYGKDFKVGYSPERINPGDKVRTLETIVKIVAGSDSETTEFLAEVYGLIVKAGIYLAPSIKVAEAAKIIENTQRDLNIALMNELAIIFEKMNIDTSDVLEAAGTKWNFLPFRPGLVGGHCIGVDPYYLTFKAQALGYHSEIILSGRRINDNMSKYIAECAIKKLIKNNCIVNSAKVGILGFTFKENVPDIRNTKVIDLIRALEEYNLKIVVHDAYANPAEAMHEYKQSLVSLDEFNALDLIIVAVQHDEYTKLKLEHFAKFFDPSKKAIVMDIKGFLDMAAMKQAGIDYWRL